MNDAYGDDDGYDAFCFFHGQDFEMITNRIFKLRKDTEIWLTWGSFTDDVPLPEIAQQIVSIAKDCGYDASWDEKIDTKVLLKTELSPDEDEVVEDFTDWQNIVIQNTEGHFIDLYDNTNITYDDFHSDFLD